MRKGLIYFGIMVTFVAVFTQLYASTPGFPKHRELRDASFKWEEMVYDFGSIKKDIPVSHKFTFTNNGDSPLVINSVQASCGCTVTDYSKDPILPGSEGFVKATYNAASLGVFTKSVTVTANTAEGSVNLSIKGVVIE